MEHIYINYYITDIYNNYIGCLSCIMFFFTTLGDAGGVLGDKAIGREIALGEYVGRATYSPRTRHDLKFELWGAIGKVVDLKFVGVAEPDEQFAGQRIFQECNGKVLCSSWVPEEDLDFTNDPGSSEQPAVRQQH